MTDRQQLQCAFFLYHDYLLLPSLILHVVLIILLIIDLAAPKRRAHNQQNVLRTSSSSKAHCDNYGTHDDNHLSQVQKLTGDIERLLQENSMLSITIKNLSDKHALLCEICSVLHRQRRDSKESLSLLQTAHQQQHRLSPPASHASSSRSLVDDSECYNLDEEYPTVFKPKNMIHKTSKSESCLFTSIERSSQSEIHE